MNQQSSTINKKVKVLKDGAMLDGCLLGFCIGRDQLGSHAVYGIVQKEDGRLEEFPVSNVKITGDVTSNWLPIETAPMDGTVIDVWVSDTNAGPIRVVDVKYDAEKECFVHF
ncbi:hypothetical protein [Nitrosomonas communis]|uniref:Uncharacterized protein n=1 Tax=Nitrosomonas communis TaxID=44574 RepID=A0A1I4Q894_9PROT|nr:hypothetical protein [Nitrosomonas communis]SFM36016.1 hypothetical protein SAMN05421863_102518 [Nitrosomonas communis]